MLVLPSPKSHAHALMLPSGSVEADPSKSTLNPEGTAVKSAVGAVFGVGFYREFQTKRQTHINHGRFHKEKTLNRNGVAERVQRRKLVRRHHLMTIASAWVITVPAAAILAAVIFHAINLVVS